ncbi:MAG: hypothetical protein ACFFC6_00545 [Promethearchaeota archaeon]
MLIEFKEKPSHYSSCPYRWTNRSEANCDSLKECDLLLRSHDERRWYCLKFQSWNQPCPIRCDQFVPGTPGRIDDLEKPPTPKIYCFPYPKGQPAACAEAISKLMMCPSCLKKCESTKKSCPGCGFRFC